MKVVIDTNVLVSGLLSPYGPPAKVLQLLISGQIEICFDTRILIEYTEVLHRPKFEFDKDQVSVLIREISSIGVSAPGSPLPQSLPDFNDDMFLEVAVACGAECIITGNTKHFPKKMCGKVKIFSPADFVRFFNN